MAQELKIKIRGLYSSANELSSVPEGACEILDDVVIDNDGLPEPRRGIAVHSVLPSDLCKSLFSYNGSLLAHYGSALAYDSSGWNALSGSYSAISSLHKIRSTTANQNLYLTTSNGVYRLDSASATPVLAGMPPALDLNLALTGSSGFMANTSMVAYRVVWILKDGNKNLHTGAPSGRVTISNSSGGTRDVVVTLTVPSGVTTSHLFQVYRSKASAGTAIEPDDELQLVYEAAPTSGEISAGVVSFTDSTPESLRGDTLYTAPSQDTIKQAGYRPPLARDLCEYKGYVFYANVTQPQRLRITMLAVGGSSGVAVNDTVTIAGVTYTGKSSENVASAEFAVVTSGSAAQNIRDTAQSLVRVINRHASNTSVYATYLSGSNDLPGQILIEGRSFSVSQFAATGSNGGAFSPELPTSGTAVSSSDEREKHAVYVSRYGEGESVPLVNKYLCGSASAEILRVIPLRDSVFILKEDGIFRITGSSLDTFVRETFDTTTILIAPESARALQNEVWMLSNQGVVSVSDTGVQVRSRQIEGVLFALFGKDLNAVRENTFAIAYETDRRYILFTITEAGDTYATQAYCCNLLTTGWTRWNRRQTCGIVHSDDKLYLGYPAESKVNVERKTRTQADFVDEADTTTYSVVSSTGTTVVLNTISGIDEGDVLYQGATVSSVITAIDPVTTSVTVQDTLTWSAGAVTLLNAYECIIQPHPATGGNPGAMKQWPEVAALFKRSRFHRMYLGFRSEISKSFEEVPIDSTLQGKFGLFPFGNGEFGGVNSPKPVSTYVPAEKQWASQLTVRLRIKSGQGSFAFQGFSLPGASFSTEVR